MADYAIRSTPTITRAIFAQALANRHSPAAPLADAAYGVCEQWAVNPAVALAFFVHESGAGTKGVAARSRNWGNLRKGRRAKSHSEGFAYYTNWLSSLDDFCGLLRGPLYEGAGLKTVSKVTPRYAPSADGNNPVAYAANVNELVAAWAKLSDVEGG